MASICSESAAWEGRANYGSEDGTGGVDAARPLLAKAEATEMG